MQAFLRYAEDVSHADVQELWARVLSDQLRADRPPVSLATLDSLRLMEPRLAHALNRILDLWMAFGNCLDQANERFEPGTFHVFKEEHLVLQSIGLVDIESRLDNYIAFHDFGLTFGDVHARFANIHVTRLAPSWRGKELARVIRPEAFEKVENGTAANLPASSFGDWSDPSVRSGTLAEWVQTLSTMCDEVRLVGQGSSSDDADGRTVVSNVQTHRWKDGCWQPLGDIAAPAASAVQYPDYVLNARLTP